MVAFAPLILNFFSVNNQIIIKIFFFSVFFLNLFSFFISGGCIHLFNFLCPRCFFLFPLNWWPKRFPSTAFAVRAKSVVAVFGRFIRRKGTWSILRKVLPKKTTFDNFSTFSGSIKFKSQGCWILLIVMSKEDKGTQRHG